MTRILYWNLENFTAKKVGADIRDSDLALESDELRQIILKQINPTIQNPGQPPVMLRAPDIVIIVEVYARTDGESFSGVVLPSHRNASVGLAKLLREFRSNIGPYWCLVPPLTFGKGAYCEAVAAFYNAWSIGFAGPYIYSRDRAADSGMGLPPTDDNLRNIMDYPVFWKDGMPNPGNLDPNLRRDRDWPLGDGLNVKEYQSAGKWRFRSSSDAAINFPTEYNRPPFYTRFWDYAGNRWINVFAIHTSPDSAAQAVSYISDIPEVITVPNDNVNVVVGDFNVDSFENGRLDREDNP